MVVLNQLPVVIDKHTKNRCLFTRDVLGLSVADINEQLVAKSLRDETDKRLWRRLVKHWTTLSRASSNKISAVELARLFGPRLIGYANTSAAEKAVKFVEKIINDAVMSPEGTTSGGIMSAPQTARSLTETSINQELMIASSSKLKESSFYQDFIQSTHSSGKLKQQQVVNKSMNSQNDSDDDDDDENDDIDALVSYIFLV